MKKWFLMIVLFSILLTMFTSCVNDVKNPSDPNVFQLSSLPDIGEFSGKTSDEKFTPEVTADFIPSDEYGKIVPFMGSYRVFETPKTDSDDWHTKQGYVSYGFMTPDGKTVMEASDKNSYINYQETDDGFGYYVVMREARQNPDAPDEYVFGELLVVPLDGSWSLTFGEYSWISFAGNGYIAVCDYPNVDDGEVRTLVYDYDGNLVKTMEGIDDVGFYSEGFMKISEWKNNEYTTSFINEDGDVVFGPYKSAANFNKFGISSVEDENGIYLMNIDGVRISEYYRNIFREYSSDMSKQVFCCKRIDNNLISDIYSDKGEYLGSLSGSTYFSFRFPDNGEIYGFYTLSNNDKYNTLSDRMMWIRLSDGTEFVSNEDKIAANDYLGHDNCYVYLDKEKRIGQFFDGDGITFAEIDDIDEIIHITSDNRFILYLSGIYDYKFDAETGVADITDTRKLHIYDTMQNKIVYTNDEVKSAYMPYYNNKRNDKFVIMPVYRNDNNGVYADASEYLVYDLEQNKLLFENLKQVQFFLIGKEIFINTCSSNTSAVYDENFNIIRKSYFE